MTKWYKVAGQGKSTATRLRMSQVHFFTQYVLQTVAVDANLKLSHGALNVHARYAPDHVVE